MMLVPIAAAQVTNNPNVYAFEEIIVETDKTSYSDGDTIMIFGTVRDLYPGIIMSIIVTAPNGNIVSITLLEVNNDKTFSTEHSLGGSLMKIAGTYTITVQYGDIKNNSATTSFDFGGVTEEPIVIILEPQHLTLTQNQLNTINHQINKFETKIINIQTTIDSQQARLDTATLNNSTQRIDKLTANIEGMTALQNIFESLITLAQNQIKFYS